MKIGTVTVLALAAAISLGSVVSYVSYSNYGNRTERSLDATLADNENIYANGTQKVIEIAQVPAIYADAVSKVTREAISGRYGDGGSKAVLQLLVEQNPQLDPAIFAKISQAIEGFRNEFQQGQKTLIDKRRSYETALGNVWGGFWLGMTGYPKVELSKYDIVTTDKAATTFRTKRDTGIQLK